MRNKNKYRDTRNPVRILILITRHRYQFSCKSEDRSQLFAYRYERFRKKKKKEIKETATLQQRRTTEGNKRNLITKKFDQRFR